MSKIKCDKCGSEKVTPKDGVKRTCRPDGVKPDPFKRISYGYFYTKYTCECGHTWEIKK